MVPKLAAKGTSFKGAAAYYLHDKGADTSERVAWSTTLNLATENPDVAWRIMAATAMQQGQLKADAGIRSTGRKSADVVLAYSLAWHPEEKSGLSRDEMMRAVMGSLEALGANDRQVLIACHDDEPHPHVHVIVNRVSPEDGRMLSSSKEKLNLSKWAEAYERGRGKIYCEERVANNEARDVTKAFTRAAKDKPRPIYELEQQAARDKKDRPDLVARLKHQERAKDAALSRKGRELRARHLNEASKLTAAHRDQRRTIDTRAKEQANRASYMLRERHKPAWQAMFKRHFAEERAFQDRETRIGGKLQNAIAAIKTMAGVRGENSARGFLGQAFNYISSSAERLKALKEGQVREKRTFATKQRSEIKAAVQDVRADRRTQIAANAKAFVGHRNELRLSHGMDLAAHGAEWRQRNTDRKDSWLKLSASMQMRRQASAAFARSERPRDQERER